MARSFNGTTDRAQIAAGFSLPNTPSAFTTSTWLYLATLGTNATWFSPLDSGANGGMQLRTATTNKIQVVKNNVAVEITSTTALSANTWYNAVITFGGGNFNIYIGGPLDAGPAAGDVNANITKVYQFGSANTGPNTQFWPGRIAEHAVWSVVLTTAEIIALSKGARPFNIRPASLTGYWPLDGLASPEPDLSSNHNSATLTGTALADGPPVAPFTPRGQPILLPVEGISGARGFGATKGAGTTDLITVSPNMSIPVLFSYHVWLNRNGAGGANAPRAFQGGNTATAAVFFDTTGNLSIRFFRHWTVADGQWTSPFATLPGTGIWFALGASYDGSSTSNQPIMYKNGVNVGAITTNNTPSGAASTTADTMIIGNIPGSGRVWDGSIAYLTMWNAILTPDEFAALAQGVNSFSVRPKSIIGYWPLGGIQSPEPDLSGFAQNGALTGTIPRPGPPVAPFSPRWPQGLDVVAAPSFNPAWRVPFNQVVSGGVAT